MELAFLTARHGGHELYRAVDGDGHTFGVEQGDIVPLERTICPTADAAMPAAVEDTGRSDGVRAYICAPVLFPGDRVFGRLGCVSARPVSPLGERELRLMQVIARLVGERIEAGQAADQRRALERETGKRQLEATGVGAFLSALEIRDSYTGRHTDAVVDLALEVAHQIGLDTHETREVGHVALLHDIGKIGVPDSILQKPGPLDDHEWEVMRTHPELGAKMVGSVVGLDHLARAVRAEHERWDGSGYPDGLRGRDIPMASQIVFACDAYHAMTSDRPYRRALRHEDAVRELQRTKGAQFCPEVVDALLSKVDGLEVALAVPA